MAFPTASRFPFLCAELRTPSLKTEMCFWKSGKPTPERWFSAPFVSTRQCLLEAGAHECPPLAVCLVSARRRVHGAPLRSAMWIPHSSSMCLAAPILQSPVSRCILARCTGGALI